MALFIGTTANDEATGVDGEPNDLYGDGEYLYSLNGGNDTLVGGAYSFNNYIFGEARFDMTGGAIGGADLLIGGDNSTFNQLFGESFNMYNSTGGNDTLIGGANTTDTNLLIGDAVVMVGSQGGDDFAVGGNDSNLNSLYGDAQALFGSTGGNDTLVGASGSFNYLHGDGGFLSSSTGGNDLLISGDNATNYLFGDASDFLAGSSGGNDTLISGTGTDHMWGDSPIMSSSTGSNDVFAFLNNNGNDFIYDFETGKDVIDLQDYQIVKIGNGKKPPNPNIPDRATSNLLKPIAFADLSIQVIDGNSVVKFDPSNSITLTGVVGLTADNFLFS